MMRFVTGGACQGKHAFVSEKFPQEMCITIKEEQILENMSAGIDTILVYTGVSTRDYVSKQVHQPTHQIDALTDWEV